MRQSGLLAAGALHALRHNRARLADDHANARRFAEALAGAARIDLAAVETNIVNVDLGGPAEAVVAIARELGVLVNASGPRRLRAVMHLDVSADDAARAAGLLRDAIARTAP